MNNNQSYRFGRRYKVRKAGVVLGLTLPNDVMSALDLQANDYVEYWHTEDGRVYIVKSEAPDKANDKMRMKP